MWAGGIEFTYLPVSLQIDIKLDQRIGLTQIARKTHCLVVRISSRRYENPVYPSGMGITFEFG
jgi:hypothetical protein